MEFNDFKGKKVFVKTISDRIYNGIVDSVDWVGRNDNGKDIILISLTDKFGKLVAFATYEIRFIEEQKK